MSDLAIGDRVIIHCAGHPWNRHTGTIAAPLDAPGFDWSVEIDNQFGHCAGAASSDLRKLDGGSSG